MERRNGSTSRRSEIIETTYRMIAEDGPTGLSLRAIGRRCGMSAPGVIHHFPTLADLLREVVQKRDQVGRDLVEKIVRDAGERLTLVMLADEIVRYYYSENIEETRNFDALEAESYAVGHPAHGAYTRSSVQPFPITRRLAERDYEDPETALIVLGLLADGMRARWLRDSLTIDRWPEWEAVRERVLGVLRTRPRDEG